LPVTDGGGLDCTRWRMIAACKRPRDLHFIDTLPKLPNGKVEEFKLRAPL
jgi:acyl-coenzyme A synthetase/AMP-(fatty) acid ligase